MRIIRFVYLCLLFEIIFSQTETLDTAEPTFKEDASTSKILQKEGSITVDADDYIITFNCKDFKDGEEMYFKIKAVKGQFYTNHRYNGIYYEYIDAKIGYKEADLKFVQYQFSTDFEYLPSEDYEIKYFTITKRKSEFRGTNGELLLIYFWIYSGTVEITNTLEDEGKFETWKIVVIVVVIVVVLALIIGCYCYRRKKQLAAANQNAAYTDQVAVNQYNNAQYNQTPSNYNVNQPYNQPYPNSDPNQQYNQPVQSYDPNQQYNQPEVNYVQQY